jgi:hypothetical protein
MTTDPMNVSSGSSARGAGSDPLSGAAGGSTARGVGGAGVTPNPAAAGTSTSDPASQSVGQLLSDISTDFSTLMRQELELAKAELRVEATKASTAAKEEGTKAGKAAGMLGAAGYIGHFAVLFLSLALWALIADLIDSWGWAFLIVGVLYAIVAAVLASMGRKKLKEVDFARVTAVNPKPQQTVETLQEVPGALKPSN